MGNKYRLTLNISNGTQSEPVEFEVPRGEAGASVAVERIDQKNGSGEGSSVYFTDGKSISICNGKDGKKGESGKDFRIEKVYPGVDRMNEGFSTDGVPEGGYVIVVKSSVNDEDNAKIYIKGATKYELFEDLSGSPGIQGEEGTSVTVTKITESTESGGTNLVSFSDGKTITIRNGIDGGEGRKGDNGDDGTPVTHSWSGTFLTVTSASGQQTVNLKGETGDSVVSANLEKI